MQFTKENLKQFFQGQIFLHLLSFGVLLLSLCCFFASFTDFNFNSTFNSDSIGVPYMFKDIFLDGGNFKDWRLGAAPTFFPDLVLYYILFLILGTDFITLTFVYGVIQTLLISGLSVYIFRKLITGKMREFSWLIPLFYSFAFFESYYIINDQMLGYLMVIYCYHTGSFVTTLACFSIMISDIKFIWKLLLLFVIGALAAYSDILYVVMFLAPMCILNIIQYKFHGLKRSLLIITTVIVGASIGYYVFTCMSASGATNNASVAKMFDTAKISRCVDVMHQQVSYEFQKTGFQQTLTITAFTVPIIALLIVILFRKKINGHLKYLIWFYSLFVVITISASLITGSYDGTDKIRYIVGVYYFSAVVLAFFGAAILMLLYNIPWLKIGISFAVIALFFHTANKKFTYQGLYNYFMYYPPAVKALDEICEKHHLKRGIGDYWKGKWSSIFSKKGIVVVTVYPTVNVYDYGSNSEWYYNKEYDFVIPERLDTTQIRKNFVILDTIVSPYITVLKVKKFIYIKNETFPKTIE